MTINFISTKKLALLCTAVCATMLAFSNNAAALTIGDEHELGFVEFGIPSGDQDRTNYVNHLIGMGLGTQDDFGGQHFTRSNNDFGPLPTAVFALNGTSTSINLGDVGTYTYCSRSPMAQLTAPKFGMSAICLGPSPFPPQREAMVFPDGRSLQPVVLQAFQMAARPRCCSARVSAHWAWRGGF